jgi:hypothetical protein
MMGGIAHYGHDPLSMYGLYIPSFSNLNLTRPTLRRPLPLTLLHSPIPTTGETTVGLHHNAVTEVIGTAQMGWHSPNKKSPCRQPSARGEIMSTIPWETKSSARARGELIYLSLSILSEPWEQVYF